MAFEGALHDLNFEQADLTCRVSDLSDIERPEANTMIQQIEKLFDAADSLMYRPEAPMPKNASQIIANGLAQGFVAGIIGYGIQRFFAPAPKVGSDSVTLNEEQANAFLASHNDRAGGQIAGRITAPDPTFPDVPGTTSSGYLLACEGNNQGEQTIWDNVLDVIQNIGECIDNSIETT